MKDGKVSAQGTLDDIIAADPDMYSEYNKAVELATESEVEAELSGNESESTRAERLQLQREVKKRAMSMSSRMSKGMTNDRVPTYFGLKMRPTFGVRPSFGN